MGSLKENFEVFSSKSDSINMSDLGNILRSMNINVTEAQAQNLIAEICPDAFGTGKVTLAQCEDIYKKASSAPPVSWVEELTKAFQAFDPKNTGKVDVAVLRKALGSIGEKLTKAEIDELIQDAGGGSSIDYKKFIGFLLEH